MVSICVVIAPIFGKLFLRNSLGVAMRMVAQIGGFLGRKRDGDPGATVLWRGLDKLSFITDTFRLFHPALPNGP